MKLEQKFDQKDRDKLFDLGWVVSLLDTEYRYLNGRHIQDYTYISLQPFVD
jgi:hypothetical protein